MAIVLTPQDCLSSPHQRQNSFLTSARSNIGRNYFQPAMVLSPAVEDSARHNHMGLSPPGDGLLPIPPRHGQARILSKGSPPSEASSALFPPPFQRSHLGPSPRLKSYLSRSASAILPTPLAGSPPTAEGVLKRRLPFKVVQGNGLGNNNDLVRSNPPKKPNDVRNGAHKGSISAINHLPNKVASRNLDKAKSALKFSHNADGSRREPQDSELKGRCLEGSNSVKVVTEKNLNDGNPVVTILQRPQTEEAAAELFAKFFQHGSKQALVPVDEGIKALPFKSVKACAISKGVEHDTQGTCLELSECESFDGSSCGSAFSPLQEGMTNVKKDVKVLAASLEDGNAVSGKLDVQRVGELLQNSMGLVLEPTCDELAPWERWAGPSYINSPPPSALPLPHFSRKLLKVVTVDNVHYNHSEDSPNQGLTSLTSVSPRSSVSPLYASLGKQRPLNINLDAVAMATKDLRRILNLDLCRL